MMRSAVASIVVVVLMAAFAPLRAETRKVSALPEHWRKWIEEEVYPLITKEQRKAFLALDTEAERQEFAERLWIVWGQESGLGVGFRRTWDERLEMCRTEFGNTTEDRARVLLLQGPPDARVPIDCDEVFYPLDIWQWARIEGIGQQITVIFYKPYGVGRYRLWDAFETRQALYSTGGRMALEQPIRSKMDRPEYRCGDADEILGLIGLAEYWSKDSKLTAALSHVPVPEQAAGESASARFLQFSTLVAKDAQPLDFAVKATTGARRGAKVSVSFTTTIDRQGLGTAKVGDVDVIQLDVTGELERDGAMADRFRYAFTFPAASAALPVVIERELRPGSYRLRLKVQDSNSKHAGIQDLSFEAVAPSIEPGTAAEEAGAAAVEKLARAPDVTLALTGPEGEGLTGVQRFTALAGTKVARVEFLLDDHSVLTKNRPPFEVELDLGPFPRLATVSAIAYDAVGKELDRKKLSLNVGRERFLVRLQPIGSPDRAGDKVHVQATVNVPPEKKLARVELYWNESLMQTLYGPPFEAWLSVGKSDEIGYLRALAVLDDGAQAEDVEFVNAPQFLQGVRVEAVELPVTVLDDGKPVEGLKKADFEVLEDGVAQAISHFSLQRDLPIRLGLVLDTSGSMEKTLPEVQRVVMGFLRNLLRPQDRAYVISFSDRPALIEGFTADFGSLERALLALKADRETALYDAVVYGLFQFSGVRGRKAMIVLTDGEDNASKMEYDRMLDYARRSGVTIYAIGIDLPITRVRVRSNLSRLARMTGGEAFFLARDSKLDSVYEQINRELRTQYLLAYTSNSEKGDVDTFRKVAVKVNRPKVEVRTIAGYYPGG